MNILSVYGIFWKKEEGGAALLRHALMIIACSTVDTDGHSESDHDALGSHGSRTAAFSVHPKVNIFKM